MERLAIVGPDALADVLTHNCYDFEKPLQLRKGISRILGMGLFLAEGEVHKKQRKNLMPAFAYRHVKNLYPMFWTKSREMATAIVASLDVQNDGALAENVSVEVNEWATRATLDIIGQGGFGQSFNAIQDPENKLSQTYRSIFKQGRTGQILGLLGFLLPQWLLRRLPLLRNDRMKRASNFIRALCRSSIESKRKQGSLELEGELDILTVAMKSGGFSDEDLVDQMMTFLAAVMVVIWLRRMAAANSATGHETTASALTWAIYVISKNPQVQSRLRDEVDRHLPNPLTDSSSIVTAETFEQMPYLSAVCREVLRLYAPVSVSIRVAVKDTTIAGQAIKKGTTIMPAPWAVNGSIDLWGGDALEFKPERWEKRKISDNERKGTNYDYMTFLHGPRSCIGQTFAVGELSCLLAAWIAAFETRLTDPDYVPVVRGGITAKPRDGVHVHLKPREDR
ncbi:MAG: hypothetical protein Q9195_007480 [Heterodermia aff. obscurata]